MGSSKSVVIGLAAALVAALLVIAFLLGRESRSGAPASVAGAPLGVPARGVAPYEAAPEAAPARTPAGDPVVEREAAQAWAAASADQAEADRIVQEALRAAQGESGGAPSATAAPRPGAAAASAGPEPAAPAAPATGSAASDTAALRAYFARVDATQVGPAGSDPQSFAQELLAASMSGDASRFDQLVLELQAAEAKLAAIVPPPEAAAHHRALIEQSAQARAMLAKVGAAIGRKDPSALSAMAADAERMQAAANALQQQDEALRRRL